MTGPEHYKAGEELLAIADHHETNHESARDLVATAQAHFTAALAAATAMIGHSGGTMSSDDFNAWDEVAGA